jgi:predicted lipoprotein with Yx(FWY)xxD motif
LTRDSGWLAPGRSALGWVSRVTVTILLTGLLAGTTAVATVAVASAQNAPAGAPRAARVVAPRHRVHFGKILVTRGAGMALYTLPHGACTGACLGIWPRLVMPAGKTIPRGASCLGTAKFGRHRLQVTYHGKRLYTFVGDTGHSVNGNGVQGFKVAKVIACRPIPRPIPGPMR